MAETSDIIIAAGAVGLGWWIYHQHQEDKQTRAVANKLAELAAQPAVAGASAAPARPTKPVPTAPSAAKATATPTKPAAPASTTSSVAHPMGPAVAPAPSRAPTGPRQPITRDFDPLFAAFGNAIPISYLRALAAHESDMHPGADYGRGAGLFSIVPIVLQDFNDAHSTHFTRSDLLVPLVNVQVAADALRRRVIEGYRHNHPNVPNLHEDWRNPRFVELVTFGWNAGFSERAGVGRVATVLEHAGRTDITIDLVAATAREAGASPNLSNPGKVAYAKSVTATYFDELARDERDHVPLSPLTYAQPAAPTANAHELSDTGAAGTPHH